MDLFNKTIDNLKIDMKYAKNLIFNENFLSCKESYRFFHRINLKYGHFENRMLSEIQL